MLWSLWDQVHLVGYTFLDDLPSLLPLGGNVLRHTEINLDIVIWTRLLNRVVPSSGDPPNEDSTLSSMAITGTAEYSTGEDKPKQTSAHPGGVNGDATNNKSPPTSPQDSITKSPFTSNGLFSLSPPEKDDTAPISGEVPPSISISEYDLVSATNHVDDYPIIPPPHNFLGSTEDLAARGQASEGSRAPFPISTTNGDGPIKSFPGDGSGYLASECDTQQPQPQPSQHCATVSTCAI